MIRTTIMLTEDMHAELIEIAGPQSDMSKQIRAACAHWIQLKRKRGVVVPKLAHNKMTITMVGAENQIEMEDGK